ncbi:unnamed protein product [Cyprideis torosa]|uniref:Uncharacterized protein n=1 Tax=Cyprideis torosa TaxID=163714 RepID=A0A7R8W4D5_9CRUS|nr:unnamed protein product [Cyprideis torosa]CAG0884086.1 unnamed protein product [Cyprideis torosa]
MLTFLEKFKKYVETKKASSGFANIDVRKSLGSISNIDEGDYKCPDGSSPAVRHKVISGVVGAPSSVTSIQVANLLRLFKIPQVSFFSTSPELSNKQRFEYFSRTIPSDHYQVKAMVEIVKMLNWTYISILYEESNYGIKEGK